VGLSVIRIEFDSRESGAEPKVFKPAGKFDWGLTIINILRSGKPEHQLVRSSVEAVGLQALHSLKGDL
jgi:hypothetical protein